MRIQSTLAIVLTLCAGLAFAQTTKLSRNWRTAALSDVKASAEDGVAEAQGELALRVEQGRGMKKDQDQANEWWRKAALQGNVDAQIALASRLIEGTAVEQKEALSLYQQAADAGDARAAREAGLCFKAGKGALQDHAKALAYFKKAAEKNDAQAQYQLGMCYRKGEGVAVDPLEATKWLRKAAGAGSGDAMSELAGCYRRGEGVTKDPREAFNLYTRAAGKGSGPAQWELAKMYRDGDGVPHDPAKAVLWLKKLVLEKKHVEASQALAQLNMDAFKQSAKPLAIRAGEVDESQVGALVKTEGEILSVANGAWRIAVKVFGGKEYAIQVAPPSITPPEARAAAVATARATASRTRTGSTVMREQRSSIAAEKSSAPPATSGMDPTKVKPGMRVSVWGTLADQKTVKGIVCQLAPPSFEWKYNLRDTAGVVGGSTQKYTIDGAFKNTGKTPLKNVKLHVHIFQTSSPNDDSKDYVIDAIDAGQTIKFTIEFNIHNYTYSGGTSKPNVDMEVTGYEY